MNPRFSDYVTSGAFQLSLTRNQIASLQLAAAGTAYLPGHAALERKGLVEVVRAPDRFQEDRVEYRLTRAGLHCSALIAEAGLSNGPADPIAAELEAIRAELDQLREEASQARLAARSALARKEEAEAELANALGRIKELQTGERHRLAWNFRTRDPLPEATDAQLAAMAEDGAL